MNYKKCCFPYPSTTNTSFVFYEDLFHFLREAPVFASASRLIHQTDKMVLALHPPTVASDTEEKD